MTGTTQQGPQVNFDGAKITKTEKGFTVQAAPWPSARPRTRTSLTQRVLEVGERLRDGTVVLSVDLEKNQALFVPAKIFGGKTLFDQQDNVVKSANQYMFHGLHGHKDWRRITDAEGETLSKAWDKVAPAELQGRSAPRFWLASFIGNHGSVRRSGEAYWDYKHRITSVPVPVVRSGPARIGSVDIYTLPESFVAP